MLDTSSKLHHIFGFNFDEIIAPLITFPLNFDSQVNRVNLYKLKKNNDKNKHGGQNDSLPCDHCGPWASCLT